MPFKCEMAKHFFVVNVHICERQGTHLSVTKMISLVLLGATFDLIAAETTPPNPCNETVTVNITNPHANPWCESTCSTLHSQCTLDMSLTSCSALLDEYTCEAAHGSGLLPACHWNESATHPQCVNIYDYCVLFSNETECNNHPLCKFVTENSLLGGQINVCRPNSTDTAYQAQGSQPFHCIDCSALSGNETTCNSQIFCYHNGTHCKRTPEAPTACSADDADDDDDNMPLILGLSIGLGVPFLLVVIYFIMTRKRGFTILDSATEGFLNG